MPRAPRHPETPSLLHTRFTNRIEHRNLVDAYLNVVMSPFPALMFYGIGGIGKSWLLRHLHSSVKAKRIPTVFIDFTQEAGSNIYRSDPLSILATLRTITTEPCPQFDIAFTLALVRRNRLDEGALRDKIRTGSLGTVWETAKGLVGLAHPAVAVALSALEKGYQLIRDHALLRKMEELFLKDLEDLQTKDLQEIEGDLIRRLGNDLCRDEAFRVRSGFKAAQAVIFVDTLEALIPAGASEPEEERSSAWLRDLICLLRRRVLFVLAGQNRLDWSFIDPDWEQASWLEQHHIAGLSEPDALDYFLRCGIADPAVQQAMLNRCLRVDNGYYTASLGLLADIAWLSSREGKPATAALFDGVDKEDMASLVRRFLKSLPLAADQDWMRVLAVTPAFDELAARTMHSEHWSQAQDSAWEMLTGLSFLIPSASRDEWYSIHSVIQEALSVSGGVKPAWHRRWKDYWNSRSKDPITPEAALGWFHLWHLERGSARQEWNGLAESAREALNMQLHLALLDWWAPTKLAERTPGSEVDVADLVSLGVELSEASLGDWAANLRKAIRCYENALQVYIREALPADWAMTQNNLGNALSDLAGRSEGAAGVQALNDAVSAYRSALEVYTREQLPQAWAATQNNLGIALRDLAGRSEGAAGVQALNDAVSAFRTALEVRTREQLPQAWAMTQNNLGIALSDLAGRSEGAAGVQALNDAVSAYRSALEVYTREQLPQAWAATQNNLGNALRDLAGRSEGAAGVQALNDAVSAYRSALEVYTREQLPQDWAMTQNNLGNALSDLAGRSEGAAGVQALNDAVSAYRSALEVRTREQLPQAWAMTQNNLGIALRDLAGRSEGAAGVQALNDAVSAFRSALEVRTREQLPQDWAATQNNLGNALRDLAGRSEWAAGVQALNDAVSAYRSALEVYTREQLPQAWAATQNNLGATLRDLAGRSEGAAGVQALNDAVSAYRRALEVYTENVTPFYWLVATRNLAQAYEQQQDWAKAREAYQQLLRRDPKNAEYRSKVEELAQKRD
jgi:tetratricopeptide (TPR) repeat protein